MLRNFSKLAFLLLISQIISAQAVSTPSSTDLRMTARVVNHYVGLTDIEVTLENTSAHDFSVVVGIITNKEHPAVGLDFNLIDRDGEVHRLAYLGVGFVAGRIDPLVLDLTAHQKSVFYVPAEQLALPPKYKQVGEMLTDGASLSIRLDSDHQEAHGDPHGLSQLPFWKGTTQTTIPLRLSTAAAPPGEADPKNIKDAIALLERYWIVNDENTVCSPRAHLITFVVQNQPEVCVNNPELLFVNPDDKVSFAAVRQLWLKQVEAHKHSDCFLRNAGVALSLSDRELSAHMLKEGGPIDLAELYANALAGVTGMTPRHGATSFDLTVTTSSFAKSAEQEAMNDPRLSGRVGWWLHLLTNYVGHEKIGNQDFDPLAEKLFLRQAELSFPEPTPESHLRSFYAGQVRKPADKQILPKAKVVTITPAELATRQLEKRSTQLQGLDHDVTIIVDVIVGIDGHVWKATARNPPTEKLGRNAADMMIDAPYRPMRVNGEPVQISSTTEATLIAPPPSRALIAAPH